MRGTKNKFSRKNVFVSASPSHLLRSPVNRDPTSCDELIDWINESHMVQMKFAANAITTFCYINRSSRAPTKHFHLDMSQRSSDPSSVRDWFSDGRDAARRLKEDLGIDVTDHAIAGDGENDNLVDEKEKKEAALEKGRAAARALLEQLNTEEKRLDGTKSPENKDVTAFSSDPDEQSDNFLVSARKSHCITICMVPPPTSKSTWTQLTSARRKYRDPGFYRWPPHANLLYPFVEPVIGAT